jgi:RNA polymerase sigma-70 factor (family 1)
MVLQDWDLNAFRRGEEHAFDKVFRAWHAPLTYYAYKYVSIREVAEDIVQDCFRELWEQRKKLVDVRSINAYLYRCVFHHCTKYLRKKSDVELKEGMEMSEVDEKYIIEAEIISKMMAALDHLPKQMQRVLQLHYLEGKSLVEVGDVMGIDPETARSHRYRALKLLRQTIIPG